MFQTQIDIAHSSAEITHHHRIMTLGSCFSENIGKKLANASFLVDINPFGVLYNPISVLKSIELLIQQKRFNVNDIFENRGLWQSFAHSSLFSAATAEDCLQKINSRIESSWHFLKSTDFLLITFGTAWVFEDVESRNVVSNCHKLSANAFVRRRLSIAEIVTDYTSLINKLQKQFPDLHIVFTISPIRHWKDGAHENSISKSTLLLAVEELQKKFQRVLYFPAYEIQLDELRDYRFYAADMLHPSDVAVDYIWQRFSETYFSTETNQLKKLLEQLATDKAHRPLRPESAEYSLFLQNIERRKQKILLEYPFLSDRI